MAGPKQLTVIASDSEFLASLELERVRAAFEKRGYAVEEIAAEDQQAVWYALDTPSLFGDGRFVVIRGGAVPAAELGERLTAWAESPPPSVAAAVVTTTATKLRKALGARAEFVEPASPKPWETADWVVRLLKGKGRVITKDAAAALIDAVGTDLRDVATAAEQLATATSAPIGVEAVARLFRGLETQLYTFLESVVQRDRPQALRRLGALMRSGEHPLAIHAAMVNQFRALALAREAGRAPAAQVAREAGVTVGHANRASRNARAWDAADVRRAFRALADADLALKGGERGEDQPGELVMERMVADLIGDRPPPPARPAAASRARR